MKISESNNCVIKTISKLFYPKSPRDTVFIVNVRKVLVSLGFFLKNTTSLIISMPMTLSLKPVEAHDLQSLTLSWACRMLNRSNTTKHKYFCVMVMWHPHRPTGEALLSAQHWLLFCSMLNKWVTNAHDQFHPAHVNSDKTTLLSECHYEMSSLII